MTLYKGFRIERELATHLGYRTHGSKTPGKGRKVTGWFIYEPGEERPLKVTSSLDGAKSYVDSYLGEDSLKTNSGEYSHATLAMLDVLEKLQPGDQVTVISRELRKPRTLTVTHVDHADRSISVYTSSGAVRPGHRGGGQLIYRRASYGDRVMYQPTPLQQIVEVQSLRAGRSALNSNPPRGVVDEDAAAELMLYLVNTSELYGPNSIGQNVEVNLAKKWRAGKFDEELAVKGYMYLVDASAKSYVKEHAPGTRWSDMFNVPTRTLVAQELVQTFVTEAKLGNFRG